MAAAAASALGAPPPSADAASADAASAGASPLGALVVTFEAVADQAEQAVDMATMCARLASLGHGAGHVGARRLGIHAVEMARQAGRTASAVGNAVVETPKHVGPLLDAVAEHCGSLGAGSDDVVRSARELMRHLVQAAECGARVVACSQRLFLLISSTLELQQADPAATGAVGLLEIAQAAGDVAELAVAAALAAGSAQQRSRALAASVEAAAAHAAARGREADEEEEEEDASDDDADTDDADGQSQRGGEDEGLSDLEGLRRLNRQVLALQRELRGAVAERPALVGPVAVREKEAINMHYGVYYYYY